MKRFARALAVTFGIAVLGLFVFLVPQTNAAADGGAPVNIMSPLPLPVTGNVGITGTPTVNANVTLPNPLPVQPVQQSTANFVSLDFEAGGYFQVLGSGVDDLTPFKLNGKQFVISDVEWEMSCLVGCGVGDSVSLQLGDHAFRSAATYANRGGVPVAGRSDHLASGFVADALPTVTVLGGTGSAVRVEWLILRGYIVP
jgi:hypothetical protein